MKKNTINEIKTDFLVIGSGISGLYSAIYASNFGKVALITKSSILESNSYWAQGGIAAAINDDDSTEIHKEDTLSVGCGLNNEDAVNIMVSEGTDRVLELIDLGMMFDKAESGFDFGIEGGHSRRRILHALGNETGKGVINFLTKELLKVCGVTTSAKHSPPRKGEQRRSSIDSEKLLKNFGWKPCISLEEGLLETINYFKNKTI